MNIDEQPSIDTEIENDYRDLYNNPFFADIEPNTPANPIGFSIPRPHRPPMDPKDIREMTMHLKKPAALNEPVQTI